jgi:hypothetical protein
MAREVLVPQLALVRVLTGGDPYRENDLLSLAFVDTSLARLVAHADTVSVKPRAGAGLGVPETILVEVVTAADPHAKNDRLVLSFVDPSVARVFSGYQTVAQRPANLESSADHASQSSTLEVALGERAVPITATRAPHARAILRFVRWDEHEARRFIAVVDRLFTVDRLGWYRHALAMRLLLPDEIVLSDSDLSADATRYLEALRSGANNALNEPLLAAFMPHFKIDPSWLGSIETPAIVAAASRLRDILDRQTGIADLSASPSELDGTIDQDEWLRWGSAGGDTFLALLLPNRARHPSVAQRLGDYRAALVDLFGQMAQAPATVRSSQMTQSNPLLDDRLWNLTGAFQDAWGVNSVA